MNDKAAEYLLITGPSGGGKERYVETQAAETPGAVIVSLESVAALIAEELKNDQSDFIEGGVDTGRTVAEYLAIDTSAGVLPPAFTALLQGILHRGLKYLSTGEIRRAMLCRALLQKPPLLILCDPFAGLDTATQTLLADFLAQSSTLGDAGTRLVLCMPPVNIPAGVTHVREFTAGEVSFDGPIAAYQKLLQERAAGTAQKIAATRAALQEILGAPGDPIVADSAKPLIEMRDVNVGWGEKRVLCHLNWTVLPGEHWLIRGPNGAGKTTLLELITGDNMQVFSNDVSLFGKRRGSGETLWDIRSRLGIVSHRLHLEYRRVGDTPLEAVLVSGFYDSIGLYEVPGDREKAAAKQWLALAGLDARSHEPFKALSYGKQRVALILRGAVKAPPLLILDEPCHGLDTEGRSLVLDLMDTVAALGTSTLLHVTHDPTEVRPFEKHVLEMKIEY